MTIIASWNVNSIRVRHNHVEDFLNKVYKCETISYAEDGLIEVSGSYAPTEATTGVLSVLQNWDTQFTVQED